MQEQAWTQQKIKMELQKEHWEKAKQDNINLILQCQMQVMMAENILSLIDKKLKEFPEEKVEEKNT